jgi:SatD family (SatD)
MIKKNNKIVLMADIQDSSSKNSIIIMNFFRQIVDEINAVFKKSIDSPLTITLGDEFQGVIKNVPNAISIIYYIEELIVKNNIDFKLRYVINEGKIDTKINPIRSYEMLGQGLTDARNQLNELKKTKSRFFISLTNEPKNIILNESFVVFQNIIDDWNIKKDQEILAHFIDLEDYKKVALAVNKDKSQIWKRNKNLNIDSYFAIKRVILSIVNLKLRK